jgi:hypothetical protein
MSCCARRWSSSVRIDYGSKLCGNCQVPRTEASHPRSRIESWNHPRFDGRDHESAIRPHDRVESPQSAVPRRASRSPAHSRIRTRACRLRVPRRHHRPPRRHDRTTARDCATTTASTTTVSPPPRSHTRARRYRARRYRARPTPGSGRVPRRCRVSPAAAARTPPAAVAEALRLEVEIEHADGVAAHQLADRDVVETGHQSLRDGFGVGPGRVAVGVVGLEGDVVDAD